MKKIVKILKQWQIILLLLALILALVSINFQFTNKGVVINSVEFNSTAYSAGLTNPNSETMPTEREHVLTVNRREVKTVEDFYNEIDSVKINETISILTDKKEYIVWKKEEKIGLTVSESPSTNLRKGLELQGGTRVMLKPVGEVTDSDIVNIIDTMSQRLNVYGLSDLSIKQVSDLDRNKYILVEIAGATQDEVKELIANQGKFEAKIGNQTVFSGGKEDIPFVCRNDGTCSRISTCQNVQDGYYCRFEFEISLSDNAANNGAEITKGLTINLSNSGQRILSSNLDFYLDGRQVDSLQIDASLRGQKATRITISGPGNGRTLKEAQESAIKNKNKLQTILLTGSLPTKLEIVKLDTISPSLGKTFIDNTLLIGFLGIILVASIIFIRYRKIKIVVPIMITLSSEILLLLGLAAMFKNNLDIAAIAGILASVGTGVNDQIVITDEIIHGEKSGSSGGNIKTRIKNAFFVILAAFAVICAAMLPLLFASAGLLVGFAFMTIAGVVIGVLITRPAFGVMIRVLLEEE